MKVATDTVVLFHYHLLDENGKELENLEKVLQEMAEVMKDKK